MTWFQNDRREPRFTSMAELVSWNRHVLASTAFPNIISAALLLLSVHMRSDLIRHSTPSWHTVQYVGHHSPQANGLVLLNDTILSSGGSKPRNNLCWTLKACLVQESATGIPWLCMLLLHVPGVRYSKILYSCQVSEWKLFLKAVYFKKLKRLTDVTLYYTLNGM